jgi:hypothetical protein
MMLLLLAFPQIGLVRVVAFGAVDASMAEMFDGAALR